jgi:hypothetical protein
MDVSDASYYIKPENNENEGSRMGHTKKNIKKKLLNFLEMRTARNVFIATLALADLTLCLFTVPVTLADILTKYWPFGTETYSLCKVILSFCGFIYFKL